MIFIFLLCRIIDVNVVYSPESKNIYYHRDEPNLPILPVQVKLKEDERVISYTLAEADSVVEYIGETVDTYCNTDGLVQFTGETFIRGSRVANFVVYPVRYVGNKRIDYEALTLHIETDVAKRSPLKSLRSSIDRRDFKKYCVSYAPSLKGDPVHYVIITGEALLNSFNRLRQFYLKRGIPTEIRTVEWIADNYFGIDLCEKVRNFIKDAYVLWGTRYVLIGGDPSIVPIRYARFKATPEDDYIPTDLYYACLDGNWNADGDWEFGELEDEVDFGVDVYVGRISVETPAEADAVVDKIITYQATPDTGYVLKMLFLGAYISEQESGETYCEDISNVIPQRFNKVKLYENPDGYPGADDIAPDGTPRRVIDSLNSGFNFILYEGHGTHRNVLLRYRNPRVALTSIDISRLNNGPRFSIWELVSCHIGAVDYNCFAEAFINNPNGGGVAIRTATRFDYPAIVLLANKKFFKLMMDSALTIGEAAAKSLEYLIPQAMSGYTYERDVMLSSILVGDPMLRAWTDTVKVPELFIDKDSLPLGYCTLTVTVTIDDTPVPGANVAVYKEGEAFGYQHTNGDGQACFPLYLETADTGLTITVYGTNIYPVTREIPVYREGPLPSFAGKVPITPLEVGTVCSFKILIKNDGDTSVAGDIVVWSPYAEGNTSPQSMVIIIDSTAKFEEVTPGDTVCTIDPVSMIFSTSIPYSFAVPFELRINDSWMDTFYIDPKAPHVVYLYHRWVSFQDTSYYVPIFKNIGDAVARDVEISIDSVEGGNFRFMHVTLDSLPPKSEHAVRFAYESVGPLSFRISWVEAHGITGEKWISKEVVQPIDSIWTYPTERAIIINWSSSSMYFNIYREEADTFIRINSLPISGATYYEDRNIELGDAYRYYVTALDSFGNESMASDTVFESSYPSAYPGWPIRRITAHIEGNAVAVDMDNDNICEIIVNTVAGSLYVFNLQGEVLDGFPVYVEKSYAAPAVGDLDNDGQPEIVNVSWYPPLKVTAVRADGEIWWQRTIEGGSIANPVLADLDGDSLLEVIVTTLSADIYIFRYNGTSYTDDTTGLFKAVTGGATYNPPAVCDLDNDGYPEIIFGGGTSNKLYVWHSNGDTMTGFPVNLGECVSRAPVVGDIVSDSTGLEIAVNTTTKLYVIDHKGRILPGWPQEVINDQTWVTFGASPVLAELDGDDNLEIIVGGIPGIYVYAYDGTLCLPILPRAEPSVGDPVVVDIDNDGIKEIFIGSKDDHLYCYQANGQKKPGFPIHVDWYTWGDPTITDVDKDGDLEIIQTTLEGTIYMWDIDAAYEHEDIDWPMHRHDPHYTGVYDKPITTVMEGLAATMKVELYPTITTDMVRMRLMLPVDTKVSVKVYNTLGQLVKCWTWHLTRGVHEVDWRTYSLPTGIYFIYLESLNKRLTNKIVVVH